MTLPRSAADVLADHVLFEIEAIDRMYLNLYQPRLQHSAGIASFFVGHRGSRFASSVLMAPMTAAFTSDIGHFIAARGVDLVRFAKGQLDNAFAAVDDVAAVQAICDGLDAGKIEALAAKWHLAAPVHRRRHHGRLRYELSVLQAEFSLTQTLDSPVNGRIFFEQVIPDNLDIGRPDQAGLVFGRRIQRGRKRPTPGRFRTRVITDGVTPSLHVDYKNSKIKQYHKLGKALRTETTINDTGDFGVAKGLSHLPELKEIGFTASRRPDVQRISHDPADALTVLTQPVISKAGTRTAGMPVTSPRVQALLAAIYAFRLLPNGFTNRDLRTHLAPLLGLTPEDMTSGQISYDLRRLRIHGSAV